MKALSIRNLPDDVYLAFSQMCAQNQRSMQEQARLMIEREVRLASSPGLSVAKQWRERLAFFPCMASFIMSFGDLNRLVLRVEPTDDPWLKMINAHTYEDDHHWPWYLEDFTKLGHDDVKRKPGDTLRFLYSDATIQNRLLTLRLAHLFPIPREVF